MTLPTIGCVLGLLAGYYGLWIFKNGDRRGALLLIIGIAVFAYSFSIGLDIFAARS